ncbi:MAG: 50S ribosomal protein L10 [Oscillospiraceae bacterium]|nr:50S ribosomal protein L10 [Oscillospiraceae bacterium]
MPSNQILREKEQFVDELAGKLKKSACGVMVDYMGINVSDDTKLRKSLREAGVDYFVVKNSMLKFALEKAEISGLDGHLAGPTAIGLCESDVITAPKLLYKQVEKSKGKFAIKAGFMNGAAVDAKTIEDYAKLPSKEELVAKLLFMLQSPVQRLAIAVNEIAKKSETPSAVESEVKAEAEPVAKAEPTAEPESTAKTEPVAEPEPAAETVAETATEN